jgi:hypothetical protein
MQNPESCLRFRGCRMRIGKAFYAKSDFLDAEGKAFYAKSDFLDAEGKAFYAKSDFLDAESSFFVRLGRASFFFRSSSCFCLSRLCFQLSFAAALFTLDLRSIFSLR